VVLSIQLQAKPNSTHAAPLHKDQRALLLLELSRRESEAGAAAAIGNLDLAARAILKALDCERRLSSLGPQVLQLIKPRP
jgi:hypothetical protein